MKKYQGSSKGEKKKRAGRIFLYSHSEHPVRRYHIEDSEEEIERFDRAIDEAQLELEKLFTKTLRDVGEHEAVVFSTQMDLLSNDYAREKVYDIITDQMINAEMAVAQTCDEITEETELSENDEVGSHIYDIRDATERVIRILLGIQLSEIIYDEPAIIVAKNLPASDIVRFNKEKIIGIILEEGQNYSYAKMLAKSEGFPMIENVGYIMGELRNGAHAEIDGILGEFTVI